MQGLGYGAGVRRRAASPRRGRQHGAAQRGTAAPRVSSQAEEVLLPVPLLQGDSPIRHTEPLCSGTDGPRRPHPTCTGTRLWEKQAWSGDPPYAAFGWCGSPG